MESESRRRSDIQLLSAVIEEGLPAAHAPPTTGQEHLVADDARAVEAAYQAVLDAVDMPPLPDCIAARDHDQAAQVQRR